MENAAAATHAAAVQRFLAALSSVIGIFSHDPDARGQKNSPLEGGEWKCLGD